MKFLLRNEAECLFLSKNHLQYRVPNLPLKTGPCHRDSRLLGYLSLHLCDAQSLLP